MSVEDNIKLTDGEQTEKGVTTMPKKVSDTVDSAIIEKAKASDNVKDVIDLAATSAALRNRDTVERLTDEKTEELLHDAEKKKIESEAEKIKQETARVREAQDKEIAELDKVKTKLEGEVENLKAEDSKAQAFFDANKSILKTIGIREKLSLKAMQALMFPASIIFTIFQILLLPFHLVGFAAESLLNIIGSICGKVVSHAWKIALTVIISIVIIGLIVGCYWGITSGVITWVKR